MTGAAAAASADMLPQRVIGTIDQTLVDLRNERQRLLAKLRDFETAAGGNPDPPALLNIAEARFELSVVIEQLRVHVATSLAAGGLPPLGSVAPQFADRVDGHFWCQARARVPLTPDSLLFVHGPVTVWHAAHLLESLLSDDDRLVSLARCGFHRELGFEPRITVWNEELQQLPFDLDRNDVAASGSFRTLSGQCFAFAAVPDPAHVPTTRAGWHPMTKALVEQHLASERMAEPVSVRQRLDPSLWPEAQSVSRPSDVLLAKAETFLAAATQNMVVGERMMLLARSANFSVEESFGAWLAQSPELQFEFDWSRQKPIAGRGSFVPFRYRTLPAEPAWQRSMFICLDSHMGL